jgi:hypothetical protein
VSVFMTLWVEGDPAAVEARAAAEPETMQKILDMAKQHGCLYHRFYGQDGQILVVDEWESEEGFHTFFAAAGDLIGPMMAAAGVTTEPRPAFWRKLDTKDDLG